jgi:DNA-binding protein YbaB
MQNDAIRPEFCGSIGDFGVVMVTVVFTGKRTLKRKRIDQYSIEIL